MRALLKKIRQLLKDRRFRKIWYRGVSTVAAIVVFITTYALVLPAITMEAQAGCGIEAHQHDDSCYGEELVCNLEESPGHTHTDECYDVTTLLSCEIPEHVHSEEEGCYDDDGNLICETEAHQHDDSCYTEEKQLVCGLQESEGHTHDSSCYEKVLVCGKEVHVHSPECYRNDAGSTAESAAVGTTSTGSAAGTTSASTESEPVYGNENAGSGITEEAHAAGTGMTDTAADSYVPALDPLNFDTVLTGDTGIYYHTVEDGETIENSALVTDWDRIDQNTELGGNDILRVYLAYTIPAGALNDTNERARYRLPGNLHLTDEQIKAINETENGIAAQFVDYTALSVLDSENYHKYLGVEAVEGTRKPSDDVNQYLADHDGQEYISAVVTVENVYDEEGLYGEKGAYLGQDLIFTFTPYSIQKNEHGYDADGQPVKAGKKVSGWLTLDFNLGQVDWDEPVTTILPADNEGSSENEDGATHTAIQRTEQTADIVFVAEGVDENNHRIHEISTKLTMVQMKDAETEEQTDENAGEQTEASESEGEGDYSDKETEKAEDGMTDDADSAEDAEDEKPEDQTVPEDKEKEEKEEVEYKDGSLEADGNGYKITMNYKAEAQIPENAYLHVTEITRESDAEAYEACLEEARKSVPSNGQEVDDKASRFFDIEILVDEPVTKASDAANTQGEGQADALEESDPAEIEDADAVADAAVEETAAEETANTVETENTEDTATEETANTVETENTEGTAKEDTETAGTEAEDTSAEETETVTRKIEPVAPVSVNIQLFDTEISQKADEYNADQYKVVHIADEGTEEIRDVTAQTIESEEKNAAADSAEKAQNSKAQNSDASSVAPATEIRFEAESFSIYGVVYTVDFHWEIDGEVYSFSIAGGDAISLSDVLRILGVVADDHADHDDAGKETEAEDASDISTVKALVEAAEPAASDMTKFMEGIDTVSFSDPSLINVSKVEEPTTTGDIIEKYNLEIEYSDKLTEEDIASIKARQFTPVDWALVTLKAFDTEEALTITMKTGEVFTIRVTDARDPLGLDDRTFSVVSRRSGGTNNNKDYSVKLGTKAGTAGGTAVTAIDAAETAVSDDFKYSRETDTAWLFEYDKDTGGYYMSQYGTGTYLVMNPNTQAKNDGTVAVSLANESTKAPVYVSRNYTESFDEETGKYSYTWDGTYRISNKPLVETFDATTNKRTTNEADLMFLWNYAGTFWVDRVGTNASENLNAVMHFCLPELDPNNNDQHSGSHKATLTSVQNLQPGQSVVIYQRVKQTDNTFKSYAIADNEDITDGSAELVHVWNSSDSVYWKNDPAILWTFKEATNPDGTPNGYYFFVNEQTGRYLAAKADGTIIQDLDDTDFDDLSKVNMREDHVQIDLPGRRSKTAYTSKIANWDYNKSYTSAPKVNDANNDGNPESITSESLNDSQEFYFAVLDPIVQKQLTEVDTLDNDDYGITMTMYDFSQTRASDAGWGNVTWHQDELDAGRLPYMQYVMGVTNSNGTWNPGNNDWTAGVYTPGLVSRTLTDGATPAEGNWPSAVNGQHKSVGNIFTSNSDYHYTVNSWPANHLFLQNVYDSTGYFRYSAFENYARFNTNTGDFAVYEQIGVPATSSSFDDDWDRYYKKRGNFMPFDDLDLSATPRQNEYRPEDNQQLDNDDPRKYEDLYRMYSTRDYFFGMVMDAKFQQDKDGRNSHGDPVRYDFNGDDDMWIYIDGVLILDIGGVHDAFHGYIDFTDGTIHVDNTQNVADTNIREQFFKAHVYPDGSEWPESDGINSAKANEFFRGNTFADYSSHKFKMIYMERGAGASNLEMQFNLTTLKQDMFKVTKDMPETSTGHTVQEIYGNAAFFYKAYKVTRDPQTGTETRTLIKKTDTFTNDKGVTKTYEEAATYEDGKTPLVWKDDETFELRPGHTAFIPVEHHGVRYYVEEVEPEPDVSHMLDNYEVNNNSPEAGQPENKQLLTDVKTVQQRAEVIYKNKPADGLINELRITKNLHGKMLKDAEGHYIDVGVGSPYFEYVVYLEDNDGKMVPYSLGEYYIIDKYGRFVYYTKDDDIRHYYGFAKNADGTYSYYEVNPATEGEGSEAASELGNLVQTTTNPKITEQFGAEGYVGDIRDGDTLVIVGLLEGTHFVVDEITYGSGITTSETDEGYIGGSKYLYEDTDLEYVHVRGEDIPEDEHVTGHLFNVPANIEEIREGLNKHDNGEQIAAEGDIKMDQDAEVTVHNRTRPNTIPILVKKNWTGIDANDTALKDAQIKVTLGRYVLKDKAGTLTIKKTGVPDGANFIATYTVKDSGNNTVAVVQYSSKLQNGVTIDVPPETYTVTETVKNQDSDYVWNHSAAQVSGITITDDGSGEADFTCNPRLKSGSLKVTSGYTAPNGANVDFSNVTYTVYVGDENSTTRATFPNGELVPPITYDRAKNGYTVQGLKTGTYTVKEDGVPINSSDGGYTLTDHTPAYVWHVTKEIADGQTVDVVFNSTYSRASTNINYIIGKPDVWSTTERITGTNNDFSVGKTVKLTFYCSSTWDRINNCTSAGISENSLITYGGDTLTHSRSTENENSKYEITFTVKENANLRVNVNANPNNNELWGVTWEEVSGNRTVANQRTMAMKAPLRAADGEGDSEELTGSSQAQFINYGTTPDAPAGKKYVEDTTFKMDDPEHEGQKTDYVVVLTQKEINSVILDGKAAWTWDSLTANAGLPAADEDGNLYYYYIKSVEEEGLGLYTNTTVKLDDEDNTFIVGKDKHFNTETNTPEALEVNNEIARVSLDVEKAWAPVGSPIPANAEVTAKLYYAKRAMTTAEGEEIPVEERAAWPTDPGDCTPVEGAAELASARISPTEIAISAASSPTPWKGSFQNLPKAIVGDNGVIYEVRYYAGEISLMIPGEGKSELDNTAINVIDQYTQSYSRTAPQGDAVNTSDGTVIITNTRETVKVTVQKAWDPVPTNPNASVTVALRRYAKKSRGTVGVVLKDNADAAIQGAVYKLYKKTDGNWTALETTATTDVNGRASVSRLGPGTYKLVQISTPAAYTMQKTDASDNFNYITESDELTVTDNTLAQQVSWTDNANKRKVTAGTATLTVTGTAKVYDPETESWGMSLTAPVEGATVTLYKDNAVYTAAQNLQTDENGQVVVSGLRAGEYYFYLTDVTDDHVMPATEDMRKSERFVIVDDPGAVQNAEAGIENVNAASRGTITVTLKRADNNEPVEGATFTLTGDGKSLSAITDSDGVARFGSSENKLNAAAYTIHQETSGIGLKPSTADQTITIDDWAENDNNQTIEVEYTNIAEGKGKVTVTVWKENNEGPVTNATIQLKKAGEVVYTGSTGTDGIATFNNLPEGTYTVHQADAGDASNDYDVASDPNPFTVVEGDADQTFTYSLENEIKTGYATIKLWKKQELRSDPQNDSNKWSWVLVNTYTNQKIGKAYTFTASVAKNLYSNNGNDDDDHLWYYVEESDHQNGDRLNYNLIQNLDGSNWNGSDGSYTFEFTPTRDGATYSIVLITDWGYDNIYSISKVEDETVNPTSAGNGVSTLSAPAAAMRLLIGRMYGMAAKAVAGGKTADNGVTLKNAAGGPLRAVADAQPNALPAAIADDYMQDNGFAGQTYRITSVDENWRHTFDPEDKYDTEGNPYYYYVVETAHTPDNAAGYYISAYEGDPLSETGDITITNTQERGGLTITKTVTVDGGAVPEAVPTIADGTYTFNITGPSYPDGHEETITVTNGQAQSTIVLNNLYAGSYTISEIGSTNPNGITLAADKTVNVAPGTQASANVAAFTNNLETAQIEVIKVWTDSEDVDHSEDTITYQILRIPYAAETDPENPGQTIRVEYPAENVTSELVPSMTGFTGSLSGDTTPAWSETVTNLPKSGRLELQDSTRKEVSYEYYIKEGTFNGYTSVISGGDNSQNGRYSFTITNEPMSPTDTETQVDIKKAWKNSDGTADNTLHSSDSIVFRLNQKRYKARIAYEYNGNTFTSSLYPVTINLYNANGAKSSLSKVVYIPEGVGLKITPQTNNNGHKVKGTGFNSPENNKEYQSGQVFTITSVNSAKEVSLRLVNSGDEWASTSASGKWKFTLSNHQNVILNEDDILGSLSRSEDPDVTNLDYTMTLNAEGNNAVITPGTNVPGQGSGTGVWQGSVLNLPFYKYDVSSNKYYVYEYEVSEIRINTEAVQLLEEGDFDGETSAYYVNWSQNAQTGLWTITNQKKPSISVTLHKVDRDKLDDTDAPLLPGAKFQLVKYTSLSPKAKDTSWGTNGVSDEVSEAPGNPGVFNFQGLEAGYYEIVETAYPDGYIKPVENPVFLVRSNETTHDMEAVLVYTTGDHIGQPITGNKIDGHVKIVNTTIIVGNERGAALPSAGGPGTSLLYLLGGLLTGLGLLMLLGRKRTRA